MANGSVSLVMRNILAPIIQQVWLIELEVTDKQFIFEIDCLINGDEWLPGQFQGTWLVTLDRRPDGTVSGTWQGRFKGREKSGVVDGVVWDLPPQDQGIAPAAADEHPRLLFRQHDIPALREKLASPLGQAYKDMVDFPESTNYLGLAVLYAITGDQSYADRVQAILENGELANMRKRGFGTGGFGHHQIAQAVTYDLAYHGLTAEFRQKMRDQLINIVAGQQGLLQIEHPNHHPCSNYYGPGYGAPAISALAYAGDAHFGVAPNLKANALKSLLGKKFSTKAPPAKMDLVPPQRRDVRTLISDLQKAADAEAEQLWPGSSCEII